MKKFLVLIFLFIEFTNILFAMEKKVTLKDEKPIYDILNKYWDTCDYNLKFPKYGENKEALYDMMVLLQNEDIKTAINELKDCKFFSLRYSKYKEQLDMTRKIKIIDVVQDSPTSIKVAYLLYTFQHPGYRLPNDKKIENINLQEPIKVKFELIKDSKGDASWLLIGGSRVIYEQDELNKIAKIRAKAEAKAKELNYDADGYCNNAYLDEDPDCADDRAAKYNYDTDGYCNSIYFFEDEDCDKDHDGYDRDGDGYDRDWF